MADFTQNPTPGSTPGPTPTPPLVEKPSGFQTIANVFKNLSTREKALIWILIFGAVIVAIVLLLILPANDRLIEAQNDREALRAQETEAQLTVARSSEYEKEIENTLVEYAEYLLKYQAVLLPEDIDRSLTTLVEDCGFTPVTLTLGGYADSTVSPHAPLFEEVAGAEVDATQNESTAEESVDAATAEANQEATAETDAASEGTPAESTSTEGNSEDDTTDSSDALAAAATGSDGADGSAEGEEATQAANTTSYTVQMTVVGYDDNFYTLLDRVVPLTWIKLEQSSFNNSLTTLETTYTLHFRIYVDSQATYKQL